MVLTVYVISPVPPDRTARTYRRGSELFAEDKASLKRTRARARVLGIYSKVAEAYGLLGGKAMEAIPERQDVPDVGNGRGTCPAFEGIYTHFPTRVSSRLHRRLRGGTMRIATPG